MARTVNANPTISTNPSPDNNSDGEWTTIPIRPRPLVSFPRRPGEATLHMIVFRSYFPDSHNKWIWNCYLDDETLSPYPRGTERSLRLEKAFVKSGHFFAEHGIVLFSLNVPTPRLVELFFGSEEDLWKADALVQQYSQAMTGRDDCISRQEHTGKMVCHGVRLPEKRTGKFVGTCNLEEKRLRELEDMNPVFHSDGERWLYRIRCVHYMSSRATKEQLAKTGETWAITFSDFRVAECFVDGYVEFNFFVGPCAGGLKWYQDHPFKTFKNPTGFQRGSGSNDGGSVSGAVESSSPTSARANKRVQDRIEDPVPSESPERAGNEFQVRVCIAEQKKSEGQVLASLLKQAVSRAEVKVTSTEQQETGIQSITTDPTGGFNQAVIPKKPEAQVTTNGFTKKVKNTATVKINTTEQGKPQKLQHLAKTTPTPMLEQEPKSQPTATGAPQDTLKKHLPLGPSTLPTEGEEHQNLKRAGAKGAKGAKITPPAKEPTSGNNNSTPVSSVPALVIQTTTSTTGSATQPSRQHRQPKPKQKKSDNIAATTTTAASTTDVSAGEGEATTILVGTSQLRIEKTPSPEATGRRKARKWRWRPKKKADKEQPAAGTAGGGEQGGMKVGGGDVAEGVVSG